MRVRDVVALLSDGERFELVGASTGKKLCSTWANKREYIESFYDCHVPNEPIRTTLFTEKKYHYTYPVISIWVLGK